MAFTAGGMMLDIVSEVFTGQFNDVAVCRDLSSPLDTFYTLVVIKDRDCAKRMLSVLQDGGRKLPDGAETHRAFCFSHNDTLCYLFPYRPERPLRRFAAVQIDSPAKWERVCINLVMECMSSALPYPLLALALESGNVHMEKDGAIYFSYDFDLAQLNAKDDERACARRCAETMLGLLHPGSKKVKSARLMQTKLSRNAFKGLSELYRDIKVTALPEGKAKLSKRFTGFFVRNRDTFFRLLLIVSVLILIFALLTGILKLIYGNVPLFRLFEDSFGRIGTRKLS
jgi:hypothetical protein